MSALKGLGWRRRGSTSAFVAPADGDAISVDGHSDVEIQQAIDALPHGGVVFLPPGRFTIEQTVLIPSNLALIGAGSALTELVLAPGSNCHVFSNADRVKGNERITLRGFSVDGNMEGQNRPAAGTDGTDVTFACGAAFARVLGVVIEDIDARNIRQTMLHLLNCRTVRVNGLRVTAMGWSGVSTSGTSDIAVRDTVVRHAGLDVMHSGVHFDGGSGVYVEAVVEDCSGNGIMLDSAFSALSNGVVRALVRRSKRGLGIVGSYEYDLSTVHVSGTYSNNAECGILVSNATSVIIADAQVLSNGEHGILLQGGNGTRNCVIADCEITGNPTPIDQWDQSADNYQVGNVIDDARSAGTPTVREVNRDLETKIKRGVRPVDPPPEPQPEPLPEPVVTPPSVIDAPAANAVDPADSFDGRCVICGTAGEFVRRATSLREGYDCPGCKAHLRYQGQADALLRRYANGTAKSLAELAQDPAFRALDIWEPGVLGPFRKYFDELPKYVMSDYWPDVEPGGRRDGVRCEDLMRLTFAAESFDLVISSDIFEHVRRPSVGFAELHRVLRPGGAHVFSIPAQAPMRSQTVVRVDVSGAEDVYLMEPRYHLGPKNSKHLVYNDFGKDIVDMLREVGFETEIIGFPSTNAEAARLLTFCSVKL